MCVYLIYDFYQRPLTLTVTIALFSRTFWKAFKQKTDFFFRVKYIYVVLERECKVVYKYLAYKGDPMKISS